MLYRGYVGIMFLHFLRSTSKSLDSFLTTIRIAQVPPGDQPPNPGFWEKEGGCRLWGLGISGLKP